MSNRRFIWGMLAVIAVITLTVSLSYAGDAGFSITKVLPGSFNPAQKEKTAVTFKAPTRCDCRLFVRDSAGREVVEIANLRNIGAGSYKRTWDGRDRTGKIVPGGQYTLVVEGRSSSGSSLSSATAQVEVSGGAPYTPPPSPFTVSASPTTFNAGKGESTTISYTVPTKASCRITVYNNAGSEVRRIVEMDSVNAGTYTQKWDGKDNAGRLVADGIYTVRVNGSTASGTAIESANCQVTVQSSAAPPPPPPTAPDSFIITSIAPNPFNAAGRQITSIAYTTPLQANLRVLIRNAAGATVRNLVTANNVSKGLHKLVWDGKDNQYRTLLDGDYTVVIEGTSTTGKPINTATAPVTIKLPPAGDFTISSITPNPFAPSEGEQATISYRVPAKANFSIAILPKSGDIVRTLVTKTNIAAGEYSITWNGRDQAGTTVSDGTYNVKIAGVATNGAVINPASAEVTIQTPQVFTITSIAPFRFNPTAGETTTINYKIPITADYHVFIRDIQGATVCELRAQTGQQAGDYEVIWNGTDSTGYLAPHGLYTVVVEGVGSDNTPIASATAPLRIDIPIVPLIDLGQTLEGVGSANFNWLNNAETKFAIAFRAPKSGRITNITAQWRTAKGYGGTGVGTFAFELQGNGADNFPDGIAVASATGLSPVVDGYFEIPIDATLTEGAIYHLVISNIDPNPAENWSSPNTLMTRIRPWDATGFSCAAYTEDMWRPWCSRWNIFNTTGDNYLNGSHSPLMLSWDDGTIWGDPYWSSAIINGPTEFFGTNRAGQYIVWNQQSAIINSIGVSVLKRGAQGALLFHLEQVGSGEEISGVIAQADNIDVTLPTWVYASLPEPFILLEGETYRLWFESPESPDNANCYVHYPVYGRGELPRWLEAGWGGTQSHYITWNGTEWDGPVTHDLTFSLR